MTDRLYYTDPYSREFDAAIVRREGRFVTLDRTSFYPTSGGQPYDTGTLGDLRVVDVFDGDDGTVTHVVQDAGEGRPADHGGDPVAGPVPPLRVGETVHGAIDWPRRFDHMQQHSGQHVLSAAFHRLFDARTVSFHLGAEVSTIDLARELVPHDVAAAETEANRIVWENRAVTIRFADAEEAGRMPLRKEPKRRGTLRLIEVADFDLSACGGTHVAGTGAIGIIAIGSWERFKGGQRIEFRCGGRALDSMRALRDTVSGATRLLSVSAREVPEAVERFQAQARDQKRAAALLQAEIGRYRAAEMAASAQVTAGARIVLRSVDAGAIELKTLASAIVVAPGHVAVLVSTSTPALVAIARSADLGIQANHVLAALTARFGGRGGGKPDLAQAGGLNAPAEEILDAARAEILGERG